MWNYKGGEVANVDMELGVYYYSTATTAEEAEAVAEWLAEKEEKKRSGTWNSWTNWLQGYY